MAESVELLRQRVQELERELAQERSRGVQGGGRARIDKMSPEVVDSNPYRWAEGRGPQSPRGPGWALLLARGSRPRPARAWSSPRGLPSCLRRAWAAFPVAPGPSSFASFHGRRT